MTRRSGRSTRRPPRRPERSWQRMPSSTSGRSAARRQRRSSSSADRSRRRRSCSLDLATGHETVLATGGRRRPRRRHAGRRTGRRSSTTRSAADDPASQRLFIVNADGTGTRQITHAPGVWFDIDASLVAGRASGSRSRATSSSADDLGRPADRHLLARGRARSPRPGRCPARFVRSGRRPADGAASPGEGFSFEWSPDGRSLIAFPSEAHGHPVADQPGRRHMADPRSELEPRACRCRRGSAKAP